MTQFEFLTVALSFVLVLVVALLLFAAGGLILPTDLGSYPDDLDDYFQDDGRWAVAVITTFLVSSIIANVVLFDVALAGAMNLWNMLGVVITAVVIGVRHRMIQGAATLVFGAWLGAYVWLFVPSSY